MYIVVPHRLVEQGAFYAIVLPFSPLQQEGVLCVVCGEEVVQSIVHRCGIQIVSNMYNVCTRAVIMYDNRIADKTINFLIYFLPEYMFTEIDKHISFIIMKTHLTASLF